MPPRYDEDTLVQQTTADYLRDALGWLIEFNPGLPEDAYREALRQIVDWSAAQSPLARVVHAPGAACAPRLAI